MRGHKLAMLCLASASMLSAQNATTTAGADGYLSRGIRMYDNKNFTGCIDQLSELKRLEAPASVYEDADFYIAMAKMQRNDADCVDALERFVEAYPASIHRLEARMALGDHYFYNNDFAAALRGYEGIPASAFDADKRGDLLFRRAFCRLNTKDYDGAAAELRQLRADSRYSEHSAYYLAYVDYARGDYDSAEQAFSAIRKNSRFWGEAQFYLCQIDFKKEKYSDVVSAGKDLLDKKLPVEMATELNRMLGESQYHLGNSAEAIGYLTDYVNAVDAPERSALFALGVCEFRKGDYENAKTHVGAVTDADDVMAQSAYLFMGQMYLKDDNLNAAALAFEKAYKMPYDESTRETAFYNYALAQSRGGRTPFSSSVKLFQDFLNKFPNSRYASNVEDYIINSYMTSKDYDNALLCIEALKSPSAKMMKAKQNVLYRLGMRELQAGKTTSAADFLTRADELAQYDFKVAQEVKLWLAETRYRQKKYKQAQTLYNQYVINAAATDANYGRGNYGLGYASYQLREYFTALAAFNKAANAADITGTLRADTYNRIADCHYYNRDFAKAETFYSKALALGTANGDYAVYQQAMMRGLQGSQSDKIALMDELVAKYPQSAYAPKALYEKAQAYEAQGKHAQTQHTFEKLMGAYPHSEEARKGQLQLALLLNSMGKTAESRQQYEALIRKFPSSEEAKVAVDDLKRIYASEGRLGELSALLKSAGSNYEINESEMAQLTFEAAENEYLDKGKTDGLEKYLKQYPDGNGVAQASFYIAEAASQNGDTTEALDSVNKALEKAPDAAFAESALGMQGDLLIAKKQYAKARESFEKLEKKATSTYNKNRAALGLLRVAEGNADYEKMLLYAGRLIDDENVGAEARAEARYARATAEMKQGKHEAAVADLNSLVDNDITSVYGSKAAVDLGTYYYNAGNYKKAEKVVNKLLDSETTHQYWMARGFILLSDIYNKQGDKFQAREYLESLKANYPGKETDIKEMIEKRLNALK